MFCKSFLGYLQALTLLWTIVCLPRLWLCEMCGKMFLPDRESNPGLPRDRRRSLPLDYRGFVVLYEIFFKCGGTRRQVKKKDMYSLLLFMPLCVSCMSSWINFFPYRRPCPNQCWHNICNPVQVCERVHSWVVSSSEQLPLYCLL